MELNFSLPRLTLLATCLMGFWLWGGFSVPIVPEGALQDLARVTKAWFYCVGFFVVGAANVSIVDHYVGTLDRSNLRFFYILLGLALMAGGCIWLRGLRESAIPLHG